MPAVKLLSNELACDICAAPMVMNKEALSFSCSKCDQKHFFGADRHCCTVLALLYPEWSTMTPQLRREFVEYRQSEITFGIKARWLLGLSEDGEKELADAESRRLVFIADHAADLQLPLLERLKNFFRRIYASR